MLHKIAGVLGSAGILIVCGNLVAVSAGDGVPFPNGLRDWFFGAQRVRALRNDLAERTLRPGYLCSVGAGWINWALESFMDEAALAAGVDPVEFGCGCSTGAAEMPDRRRTPWVARTARRPRSPEWP